MNRLYRTTSENTHLRRKKWRLRALVLSALLLAGYLVYLPRLSTMGPARVFARHFNKSELSQILGKRFRSNEPVPNSETIADSNGKDLVVQYSIDSKLQQSVEQILKNSHSPYGAFVALDAKTGQVLAMASHGMKGENLALRSSFPAASIFKVVTAAAAVETGRLRHNSLIPVLGSYHTLYKRNVLHGGGIDPETSPRYARLISFEDALAKSVNSVFGKVGIFGVGSQSLRSIATRFLFDRPIPFEMPVSISQATIPNEDNKFALAESASGYTRFNTLSPLHGALIAAAVTNDGIMMEPSVVSKVASKEGEIFYSFEPKQIGAPVIDKATAHQLELMMHKTIIAGTSRRAFRGVNRSLALSEVFIGGKTGTLNGWDPAGRYDWFVGFGEHGNSKIAIAALCIHGERRGLKASQLARMALETYFRPFVAENSSRRFSRKSNRI